MVEVAVIGFGTVGSGVVEILEKNEKQIRRAVPEGIHVKYIVDIRDFPDSPYRDRVVHDIDIALNDPEISVVCETMGGKEPARTFTLKALEKGISVCTSNKELVESFGPELITAASAHSCSYLFEAAVGGGIPLLRTLDQGLAQEDITSIVGILNGTTNYILTKMEHFGTEYADALSEAQRLGYAERNPAADVEGHDTGRKIAILASLLTGKTVRYADTYTEGITKITNHDFLHARAQGYAIRLLGVCKEEEDGYTVMTAPFLVKAGHPLHAVEDVFNGVVFHGNMVDDVMFYGRGAGKLPTGSAVVADVIHAAGSVGQTIPCRWNAKEVLIPRGQDRFCCRFFVRGERKKEASLQAAFAGQIEDVEVTQALPEEIAFFTKPMTGAEFEAIQAKAEGILGSLRVLDM